MGSVEEEGYGPGERKCGRGPRTGVDVGLGGITASLWLKWETLLFLNKIIPRKFVFKPDKEVPAYFPSAQENQEFKSSLSNMAKPSTHVK